MKKCNPLKFTEQRRSRFSTLLLSLFIMLITAVSAHSQAKTVSLNVRNASIEAVLKEVERQTGYHFLYNNQLVNVSTKVSLTANNEPLTDVLNKIFSGTGISTTIKDNQIVLSKPEIADSSATSTTSSPQHTGTEERANSSDRTSAPQKTAQSYKTIKGVVSDAGTGEALFGVSVYIDNLKKVVVTDDNGNYSLSYSEATPPDAIVFSLVGYQEQKYAFEGQAQLNVSMAEEINMLESAMVTGYQTISKERAAASYAIVSSKALENKISLDATTALEGQVAGLSTYKDEIIIRGRSTLSDNVKTTPLVVVDGLPTERTINSINMNDVKSITVLKDAAATSIYGVRGANGVIVVTTKTGEKGKTLINFTADWRIDQNPSLSDYHYASTSDIVDFERGALAFNITKQKKTEKDYLNTYVYGVGNTLAQYVSPLYYQRYRLANGLITQAKYDEMEAQWRTLDYRKEYLDNAWRTPFTQSYNLSVSNADERQNTYLSFNYSKQDTRLKPNSTQILKAYLKTTQKLTKWLDVSFGVDTQYGDQEQMNESAFSSFTNVEPYNRILDENGNRYYSSCLNYSNPIFMGSTSLSPKIVDEIAGNSLYDSYSVNVLDELERNKLKTTTLNVRTFVDAKVSLFKGLSFRSSFSYEAARGDSEWVTEEDAYMMRYLRNRTVFNSATTGAPVLAKKVSYGGRIQQTAVKSSNYTFRNQLDYNTTIGTDHIITALLGAELRQTTNPIQEKSILYGYNDQTENIGHLNNLELGQTGWRSYLFGTNNTLSDFNSNSQQTWLYGKTGIINPMNRYVSFYSNASYSYKRRYNLTGSIRIDQANLFGTNSKYRYRPLWSLGASWNASNETFLKDVRWLDLLTVRASYGTSGNVDQNSSPYIVALKNTFDRLTPVPIEYTKISTAPNPYLRWEKTDTYDVGFDFSVFKGLLSGTFDAYYKYGSDLLTGMDLDYSSGFSSAMVNNGEMSNKGVEVRLSSPWFNKSDWNLTSTLTLAYNKNKIESVAQEATLASQLVGTAYYQEGYARYSLYAYRYQGLTQNADSDLSGLPTFISGDGTKTNITYNPNGTVNLTTGLTKVDDVRYMGVLEPTTIGSFQQSVRYKGLELNFMLTYYGGHVLRMPSLAYTQTTVNGALSEDIVNAWTPLNSTSLLPKLYINYNPNKVLDAPNDQLTFWQNADVHVTNADYIRLSNISLSYSLPKKYCKAVWMQNLKLTAQANNLWFWSAAGNDIDPETQGRNTATRALPTQPSYLVRLELTF